jgi:hypothetical protein
MPHFPKPYYKANRRTWYVEVGRVQHPLGRHPDGVPEPKKGKNGWDAPEEIRQAYHKKMAELSEEVGQPGQRTVARTTPEHPLRRLHHRRLHRLAQEPGRGRNEGAAHPPLLRPLPDLIPGAPAEPGDAAAQGAHHDRGPAPAGPRLRLGRWPGAVEGQPPVGHRRRAAILSRKTLYEGKPTVSPITRRASWRPPVRRRPRRSPTPSSDCPTTWPGIWTTAQPTRQPHRATWHGGACSTRPPACRSAACPSRGQQPWPATAQ